ncbi:MAG: hypothetical protein HETSPECPRED_005616 [Heterodermia speciosa]|uniref:F-box domain-containing protein n=1 Tax=Heterodermia speciosa TaxID=116794 RepID=A0A8H3IRD9_9LECA|nr:MAG: hypothetical protein HETSPECPRED_005616 [Heterodermia speciosa]
MEQTRPSKRPRLNPDAVFPNSLPVQAASSVPATDRVQDHSSRLCGSSTIDVEEIPRKSPGCAHCQNCSGECHDNIKDGSNCVIMPTTGMPHVQKPQEARLPPANSLEGLPVELQLLIFNFLPDVDTFDALIDASPVHHRLFACDYYVHTLSRIFFYERKMKYAVLMFSKKLAEVEEKVRGALRIWRPEYVISQCKTLRGLLTLIVLEREDDHEEATSTAMFQYL